MDETRSKGLGVKRLGVVMQQQEVEGDMCLEAAVC
jgi:hypothetical protein